MFQNPTLASLLYEAGKWAGFLGMACLAFLTFSGNTARFWDRYFGLDRIIKFQRWFALVTIIFVVLHPLFFILSTGSIFNFLVPDFANLPLALGIISFYGFFVLTIASWVYKMISYAVWQYLNVLIYVLFFMGLYHAIKWGGEIGEIGTQIFYGISLLLVLIGAIYRTQYKIRKMRAGKFHVKEVQWETKDTFTLVLKSENPFHFLAGQFCFLRLNKNKLHARHPFTISSAPHQDLCFTIKLAGRFTKTASELKPGEEVLIDGPFGIFTERDPQKNLVFIAGGVGITPFVSMLQDHLQKKKSQNIILLYGAKTEEEIIFRDQLQKINAPWFQKIYALSRCEIIPPGCEKGYVDKSLIQKYVKNIDESLFYICGPEVMKNDVQSALQELGVVSKNIIVEDFFW